MLIDKLPYLLSMLFIGVGYLITYLTEDINNYPLIEYDVNFQKKNDSLEIYHYKIKIGNITNNKMFKKLTLFVDYNNDKGYKILKARPKFKSPLYFKEYNIPDLNNGLFYEFDLTNFQPNWSFVIYVDVSGNLAPTISFTSDELINFQKRSIKTIAFKNKSYLLIGLVVLWIMVIIIYFISYVKAKRIESD